MLAKEIKFWIEAENRLTTVCFLGMIEEGNLLKRKEEEYAKEKKYEK